MPVEVILPKVDMDMTHGTLATWHVLPGQTVTKGAALFDIETDKAAMEVEAPASGRLAGVTAQPGDKVAVGTVVALIYAEGEADAGGNGQTEHSCACFFTCDCIRAGRGDSRGGGGDPAQGRHGYDPRHAGHMACLRRTARRQGSRAVRH